jgi:hypothetical protein
VVVGQPCRRRHQIMDRPAETIYSTDKTQALDELRQKQLFVNSFFAQRQKNIAKHDKQRPTFSYHVALSLTCFSYLVALSSLLQPPPTSCCSLAFACILSSYVSYPFAYSSSPLSLSICTQIGVIKIQ